MLNFNYLNYILVQRHNFVIELILCFLLNTGLSVFPLFLNPQLNWPNLFWSTQLLGFTTFLLCAGIAKVMINRYWLAAGLTFGSALGPFLSAHLAPPLNLIDLSGLLIGDYRSFFRTAFIALIIAYIIFYKKQTFIAESSYQQEKIAHLTAEKQAHEAKLKMLQAQIEPHFLFNTLANIKSLMEEDIADANLMLDHFIAYLRASLFRTRSEGLAFKDEIHMLQAYLSILQIRMGKRLQYHFDISAEVADLPFPPMLLQPIIENAIKHGLEPKLEGGNIMITAYLEQHKLKITVTDTGLGLNANNPGEGVGLMNVRERLQTLYKGLASLKIFENEPSGVKVVMEIPV